MRLYLPATVTELAVAAGLQARAGRAVTDSLRAALGSGADEETSEYAALVLASEDALQRLTDTDPLRRIVVAADLPAAQVQVAGGAPGRVEVPAIGWEHVVSFHADEQTQTVRARLERARGGDQQALRQVETLDLLWYDITEREVLTV